MNRYSAGHQKLRLEVLLLPLGPFVALAVMTPETTFQIGWIEVIALFLLALAIHVGLVVVHELGHALAASLFRMPLRSITIGHWRRLFSFKVGSVSVEVRAIPDVGYVVPAAMSDHLRMLPLAALLLGGVAAESLVIALVWRAQTPAEIQSFSDAAAVFARLATLWFGIAQIVFNLLPHTGRVGGDVVDTDGQQLLNLWRSRRDLPKFRDLSARLAPVQEHFGAKRFDQARDGLLALAHDHPDNLQISEWLGQAHTMCGETAAAEAIFRRLLEKYPENKLKRAELLDWLICIAVYRDRPDLLQEAEKWMELALSCAPDAVTLLGTKGALDVACGRHDDAIKLLRPLFSRAEHNGDQAYTAASLAEAYAAKGDATEAKRWLEAALAADADNLGTRKAAATLAAMGTTG